MLDIAPQSVAHLPLVAYVCTEQGAQVARSVVDQSGGGDAALKGGGLSGAARLCGHTEMSKMVLAEMGNMSIDDACECVCEIHRNGSNVIVVGHDTDIATYRALRNAGALEYFQFPIEAKDILNVQPAQIPTPANDQSHPNAPRAFTIGIVGASGGVGASGLAHNLAFTASTQSPGKTALIDSDIMFGSQVYDFNCKGTPGFIEALASPDRVDATLLSATMEKLSDTLSIYCHHLNSASDCARLETALPDLMKPLRESFQTVVMDLPRRLVMQNPTLLEHLDAVLIVFPAGYSGVNAASRMLSYLKKNHINLPVYAVLSDVRKDAALSRKEIEQAMGMTIDATLPRSDASILKAQVAGKSIVSLEPRSPYVKTVSHLWTALREAHSADAPHTVARKGFLRRMFS